MGGSSGGSGWTPFVGVLEELFPEAEGEQAQNTQDDPTPSALPQAPAPPEVGHPVPNQGEVEELRMQLHAVIQEQIRQESERRMGPLSTQFPEQRELNSEIAHHILVELELSTETDIKNLREWVEGLKEDFSLLKPLIQEYLPKKRKR